MKIPVEKNKEYIVEIIDNGADGEGIAKIENYTIFIPNTIKGERVKILIIKVLSSHAFAKATEIIEKSEVRQPPDCISYKRCGGCNLRHVKYEKTLEMKKNIVQNLVNKGLKQNIEVESTIGMENPYFYRNKAIYPVGLNKEGKAIFGVFASRSHEIIEFEECKIQTKESQEIAKFIIEFINKNNISVYNEKTNKGVFRHIIIKYGMNTDELMCIFVLGEESFNKEKELVCLLVDKFKNVKTVVKNINKSNTNVILGKKNIVLHGKRIYSR